MAGREIIAIAIFFALIASASSVASQKFGTPDREAAVAAALKETLGEYFNSEVMHQADPPLGFAVMCVESKIDLDVSAIANNLSKTIIRPVPVDSCTSQTVEGDFGMFTALTTYYDDRGKEAGHFEVANVACKSTSECIVDLDFRGWGERFLVERKGATWEVLQRRNRWIV